MATYKVPQDVEAEDKLLGPFTFRQFIYLIVVALLGAATWGLWQIFPPLAIIPMPFLIFFGALALPLRKDQPMETYLAAIVSFYLKPNKRLWEADGIESLIEISAPKTVEVQRTKDITQGEAEQRLSYLAQIVDSRGWAVRGSLASQAINSMNDDIYFDAQQTPDILDANNTIARKFEYKLEQSDARRQEEMRNQMANLQIQAQSQAQYQQQPYMQPQTTSVEPATFNYFATAQPAPEFNPYPIMNQTVINPITQPSPQPIQNTQPTVYQQPVAVPQPVQPIATPQPVQPLPQVAAIQPNAPQQPAYQVPEEVVATPVTTSVNTPSPDIMNLVNNTPELSIETIAKQASRINKEQSLDEETVISLR